MRPPTLLAILILTGAFLSSLLTNDVVAVAMVPLLVSITLARKLNPVPFLLGFCFAVNTGAVATLIGSPHNMIAAQVLDLSFLGYFRLAIVPALVSLPIVWAIVAFLYRGRWELAGAAGASVTAGPEPVLDVWETVKTAIVTVALVVALVLELWRPELIALAAAGFLLLNRQISSRDMLAKVDGNLLILVMGLFVVNAALADTGVPKMLVADARAMGLDIDVPWILLWVVGVISDIVGNNPAVMLMLPLLHGVADPEAIGVTLSLATSFSGNIFIFGSLAGIIVVEQAAARGIKISFGEFMRAGAPVTAACMAVATAWTLWLGS